MQYLQKSLSFFAVLVLCAFLASAPAGALGPYPYYGGPPQAPENPPPETAPAPPPPPRPVRVVPVYVYPRPTYDAALAPWPWSFNFGGGPTAVASSGNQLTGGANFNVGFGGNFNPHAGLNLEFMDSSLGLTDAALAQYGAYDGSAHVWSVTLDPIWRYKIGGIVGGYVIGGGGYYHRQMTFDQIVSSPYFFGPFTEETQVDNDAGGLNIGTGFTFNLGWGTKFYVEARYHYIFTPGSATSIIPITFGFRW
jgi:hypothetical protein